LLCPPLFLSPHRPPPRSTLFPYTTLFRSTAWAEALACKLLIPAGCTGEAGIDAAEGLQVELDGKPLARGEKRSLPIGVHEAKARDRKSTRLNSSHLGISYAVFCLKKKKKK